LADFVIHSKHTYTEGVRESHVGTSIAFVITDNAQANTNTHTYTHNLDNKCANFFSRILIATLKLSLSLSLFLSRSSALSSFVHIPSNFFGCGKKVWHKFKCQSNQL